MFTEHVSKGYSSQSHAVQDVQDSGTPVSMGKTLSTSFPLRFFGQGRLPVAAAAFSGSTTLDARTLSGRPEGRWPTSFNTLVVPCCTLFLKTLVILFEKEEDQQVLWCFNGPHPSSSP